jgi:V8-like Glu-specific endopeptidase
VGLALGVIALAPAPAAAQEALKVGEHFGITIDSAGRSDVPIIVTSSGYSYTLQHEGATYIALHFDQFDLAPGDAIVLSDADGGQRYRLTGRGKMGAGAFWAQHVKGDTVVIEWITDGMVAGRGFSIDEYAAGFAELSEPGIDAICGTDDKRNAVCYQSTYPTEYDRSRAVARLLIQGSSLCTGWLASSNDHLITNEHCITSSSDALNTDYEFMAEAPNCSDSNCQLCYAGDIYSGGTFVQDNAALDYALVTLGGNPSATYGYLDIDNRDAVVGEEIYIPQHPGGDAKELGIESSDSSDPNGMCTVTGFTSGCSSSSYQDVGYSCDTEGGSSGSPVLARSSHKVIALHHCANCPNRGVPIDLICAEVCGFFGPECSVDADCDDGNPCTAGSCVGGSCVFDPIADCCGNGTCEAGEDCTTCAADCPTGTAASCGNGICETADGEDCTNCAADCNGVTNGPPFDRYCCGSDVTCADPRCTGSGNTCTDQPGVGSCCGDGLCEGSENETNCAIDCASCTVNADCADGDSCTTDTCDAGTCYNTPIDCSDGDACTADTCSGGLCSNDPISCDDGDACTVDSCDSATGCINDPIDCNDANACTIDSCSGGSCVYDPVSCDDGDACTIDSCDVSVGCVYDEPACQDGDGCCPSACDGTNDSDCVTSCLPVDSACTSDADCCSNKCRGRPGGKTCK